MVHFQDVFLVEEKNAQSVRPSIFTQFFLSSIKCRRQEVSCSWFLHVIFWFGQLKIWFKLFYNFGSKQMHFWQWRN